MINLLVGSSEEELVFLIDTGAARTSVSVLTPEMKLSGQVIRVSGVKGEGFEVPKINPLEIRVKDGGQKINIEMLYIPEAGVNLLGRDALMALQLKLEFKPEAFMRKLTQEEEDKINPSV